MQVHFTGSHPALRPFVKGYYHIELQTGTSGPILDIHPLGYHTMAFTLNQQQVFRSTDSPYDFNLSYHGLICQHIKLFPLVPSIKMVVVSFTATGASELFKVSQHQLVNQVIPFEEVIPRSSGLKQRLEDGISCEKTATDLIENWLMMQIPPTSTYQYAPNIDRACTLIRQQHGNLRIGELSREVGMSQRYLESHFKDMIGTTPKMYCRIIRFLASYQFILQNTHLDWGDVVYRYNYFDQSHFINEFKHFFGYSPSRIHMANSQLTGEITPAL